ncbi:MAG: adenylate/guanylate cyclase domain-containing protein [Treponema sp.]|nr:adenylate/guanylate cyclase domain-containing protein [Treponema sp.]
MKRKPLLFNISFSLILAGIISVLCIFNVFEKLDFRLYDGLLHLTKDPVMDEKVMVVAISDDDINRLGEWPWSRDIFADVLIRLKELGVAAGIFDIEYISPSSKSVPSNSINNVNGKISETKQWSVDLMNSIPIALNQGYSVEEIQELTDSYVEDYLDPLYDDLYEYVENNIAFDNDDYFARAIQFFGNAYLSVNELDLGYKSITDEHINFIRNNMLLSHVVDPTNYTLKDNDYNFKETYPDDKKGFTPSLDLFIRHAKGVGFTNSNIDTDGIRRRNELFLEYDGKYLGQLTFGPLMDILDIRDFERTKNSLILKNALFPGDTERADVTIPLDEHGKMLINWQHEQVRDTEKDKLFGCGSINVSQILQLDEIENALFNNMKTLLGDDGDSIETNNLPVIFDNEGMPLPYYGDLYRLVESYNDLKAYKAELLSLCEGYDQNGNLIDGITPEEYEDYYATRDMFFEDVKQFVDMNYFADIENFVRDNPDSIYNNYDWLQAFSYLFEQVKYNIDSYLDNIAVWKEYLNGKYCIFGHTAASTTDIGAIPFAKQYVNVLIHANIMNTVLTRNFITPYPWYYGLAISFVITILLAFILCKASSWTKNLVGAISTVIVIAGFLVTLPLFQFYIPMVGGVIFYLIIDFFAGVIYRYVQSSKEKRFITEIASSFANKDTVAQLRANPDAFQTKGEKKCITALFSDVQKFSTLSETIGKIYGNEGPNKLIEILNEYLGAMSDEILRNNGNIDKYEGDAIISMFGAPDPLNTHTKEEWAYLCLDSAIKMKKIEVEFNATHQELFKPVDITNENGEIETVALKPLQTRIGINSGEAFVGLMGSKTDTFSKLNYTMIGDTVNLASRLEGVNKVYSTWIMCSEDTWDMANTGSNQGKITVRRLDRVRVVGRSTPVQLYNVLGFTEELTKLELDELDVFHKALDLYLLKDFTQAGKMFVKASKMLPEGDPTALTFAERCKNYIKKGIPDDWDGVMNMTSK